MYIDKLTSSTGLPVLISEFDLNIADDTQQKNQMQSLFTMFWNDTNVKGVTYWGYIQGETWETNTWLSSTRWHRAPRHELAHGVRGTVATTQNNDRNRGRRTNTPT